MAYSDKLLDVYYPAPQPVQLVPHLIPPQPGAPPVNTMSLWPSIAGLIALSPIPTWSAQTVPKAPIPQPVMVPWAPGAIDYEVTAWPQMAWSAQSEMAGIFPTTATTGPVAPSQVSVGMWNAPTWGTQVLPTTPPPPPFFLPWAPAPLAYENAWPQITWAAQERAITAPIPVQPTPPAPKTIGLPASYLWQPVTWNTQVKAKFTIGHAAPVITALPQQINLSLSGIRLGGNTF